MEEQKLRRSTTILCVKRGDECVIASDGQVTLGNMVEKNTARKLRVFKKGKIVAGFAGSVADCMTLLDRLKKKIDQYDELERACYELAKDWRTDKVIRNLEESLIITNGETILQLTGDGNVLEPENKDIASVGSGSVFALASARALYENTNYSAEEIVRKAMKIAGDYCIYTNHNLSIEKIKIEKDKKENNKSKKENKNTTSKTTKDKAKDNVKTKNTKSKLEKVVKSVKNKVKNTTTKTKKKK